MLKSLLRKAKLTAVPIKNKQVKSLSKEAISEEKFQRKLRQVKANDMDIQISKQQQIIKKDKARDDKIQSKLRKVVSNDMEMQISKQQKLIQKDKEKANKLTRKEKNMLLMNQMPTFSKIQNPKTGRIIKVGKKTYKDLLNKKVLKWGDDDIFVDPKHIKNKIIIITSENNRRLMRGEAMNATLNVEPVEITDFVIPQAVSEIYSLTQSRIAKTRISKRFNGGINAYVKLFFRDDNGQSSTSIVVPAGASKMDLAKKLYAQSRKHYDTATYLLKLTSIHIILSHLGNKGGCIGRTKVDKCPDLSSKLTNCKLVSHKSTNNNCLLACFNAGHGLAGNIIKADSIRKALNIELNTKIGIDRVQDICNYYANKGYKKGVQVVNEQGTILKFITYDDPNNYFSIMLVDDHYYELQMDNFFYCKTCLRKLRVENTKHVCNKSRSVYVDRKVRKHNNKQKNIVHYYIKPEEKIATDRLVYFDFETFQAKDAFSHSVYASGWCVDGQYDQSYGETSLDDFMNVFLMQKNKILTAYNGANFDFYFLINKLCDMNQDVRNIILSNGRVLSFEYGDGNKVFDLCQFVMTSLDNACKAFKIKNAKSSFEHKKIQSWEDVETYRCEVEPYLKTDVMALRELFETFNDMMHNVSKVNITNYTTLSHMAYTIWANGLQYPVEIFKDITKYDFVSDAIYGGRCYPVNMEYKTKNYDEIVDKKMNYDDVIKSDDFIFNADATSLYPASMAGFDLCDVKYPTGLSRWSDKPDDEFKNKKSGYYRIAFKCPKNIRVPILPRRKELGIEWSLYDGEGIYCSVDIENAIDAGYEIEFRDRCLVWDQTANIFKNYVDKFYQMKEDAGKEGNKVKRNIAKLMLNALYGKTMQSARFSDTIIVNNVKEFNSFCREHTLMDYKILSDNRFLLTGDVLDRNRIDCVTKPKQLGGFVTAFSRRIMLKYMKAIDPTLKTNMFTYTDTDSMHITGQAYKKLKAMGYIVTSESSKLGYLCSDVDDEGVIIYEKNLAPKSYRYEFINNKNEVYTGDKAIMKYKGIKKYDYYNNVPVLRAEYYDNAIPVAVSFSGLKKKNKTLTKNDVINGVQHFSVTNNNVKRTFHNSDWSGMTFSNGEWFPKGYSLN